MNPKRLKSLTSEKRVARLFKAYGESLFQYAKHQWRIDEDAAWDLVYKAIYKLDKIYVQREFEVEQQLRSFLFKTFINYLKNHLRDEKASKRGSIEVELVDNIVEEEGAESPKSEKAIRLNAALDNLEEWQRILLLMRAQGFAYAEIARFVDKPLEQLKVYYGRLIKRLGKELDLNEKQLSDEK